MALPTQPLRWMATCPRPLVPGSRSVPRPDIIRVGGVSHICGCDTLLNCNLGLGNDLKSLIRTESGGVAARRGQTSSRMISTRMRSRVQLSRCGLQDRRGESRYVYSNICTYALSVLGPLNVYNYVTITLQFVAVKTGENA